MWKGFTKRIIIGKRGFMLKTIGTESASKLNSSGHKSIFRYMGKSEKIGVIKQARFMSSGTNDWYPYKRLVSTKSFVRGSRRMSTNSVAHEHQQPELVTLVLQAQQGDKLCREQLIKDYRPFYLRGSFSVAKRYLVFRSRR